MPWWYAGSDCCEYFYNASQQIWGRVCGSGEDGLGYIFASPFFYRKKLSSIVGALSMITVNKSGLGLLNPVTSTNRKFPGKNDFFDHYFKYDITLSLGSFEGFFFWRILFEANIWSFEIKTVLPHSSWVSLCSSRV